MSDTMSEHGQSFSDRHARDYPPTVPSIGAVEKPPKTAKQIAELMVDAIRWCCDRTNEVLDVLNVPGFQDIDKDHLRDLKNLQRQMVQKSARVLKLAEKMIVERDELAVEKKRVVNKGTRRRRMKKQ